MDKESISNTANICIFHYESRVSQMRIYKATENFLDEPQLPIVVQIKHFKRHLKTRLGDTEQRDEKDVPVKNE